MKDATLTLLLHGDSGAGKSWLAGSAPPPLLVLDIEGRAKYLPGGPKTYWDPAKDKPPEAGDWAICIVQVTDFSTIEAVYQWLQSGQHCFKSVAIDSLMEAQKRFIDKIVGMEQLQTQHWGEVLRHLEHVVRDYRDLTHKQSNTVECVIFTVGSKTNEAGKISPLLQGALKDTLPYFIDAVGYLYVTTNDQGEEQRNLLLAPRATVIAKDGTNRLGGPIVVNPDLSELFARLSQ